MATQLLQSAFTGGELSPSLQARTDFEKFYIGLKKCQNGVVQPHGGVTKRPGFLAVGLLPGPARLLPFMFSNDQSYVLCFGDYWFEVANRDGFFNASAEEGAPRLHVESPYSYEDAKLLTVVQDGDYVYLACQMHPPRRLVRTSNYEWAFEEMSFEDQIGKPVSVTAAMRGSASTLDTPYVYYVSAIDSDGLEGEAQKSNELKGPAYTAWVTTDRISVSWPRMDDANVTGYIVYKSTHGATPLRVADVGQPESGSTVEWLDANKSGDVTKSTVKWTNPFPNEDGSGLDFPGVVGVYEQRMVFTGIPSDPNAVWFSRIGNYMSFSMSNPASSADAFKFTLASSIVSMPRWLIDMRSLVVGSAAMEWEISSSGSGFSLTTATRRVASRYGSSRSIPGITVGGVVVHVTRAQNVIRDLQYQFSNDTFGGLDRSILATHLLEGRSIEDWTYQQNPDSVVWMVRDDGALLGLTTMLEHQIYAWHQHHTQGLFRHVLSIPDGQQDLVFVEVQREAGYFLEVGAPRYYSGDIDEAVFADCSILVRHEEAVEVVAGLDWLEGREVCIMADGAVMPRKTVRQGKITVPGPKKIFIIGLPYDMELVSMPLERGSTVTQKKAVNAINAKVQNTTILKAGIYGRSDHELQEVKIRNTEPYGAPPRVYSGDVRLVDFGTDTEISVRLVSDEATPCTVLALSPELQGKG